MRNSLTRIFTLVAALLVATLLPASAQSVSIGYDNALFVEGSEDGDTIVLTEWFDGDMPRGVAVEINGVDFGDYETEPRIGITVRGWGGDDEIDLSRITTDVFFLHVTPGFAVTLLGDGGNDTIFGSQGNDLIYGLAGDDRLWGMAGRDILLGGDGSDVLRGGDGHDMLDGEAGPYDKLYGGCGNDKLADADGALGMHGEDGLDKLFLVIPAGWFAPRRDASWAEVGPHGEPAGDDGAGTPFRAGRQQRSIRPGPPTWHEPPSSFSWDDAVTGGYDADYVEITIQGTNPRVIAAHGDVPRGYPNDGDQLVTFGPLDPASTIAGFESESHF